MIYPILHFCCGSAINVKHHVRWGASISFKHVNCSTEAKLSATKFLSHSTYRDQRLTAPADVLACLLDIKTSQAAGRRGAYADFGVIEFDRPHDGSLAERQLWK